MFQTKFKPIKISCFPLNFKKLIFLFYFLHKIKNLIFLNFLLFLDILYYIVCLTYIVLSLLLLLSLLFNPYKICSSKIQ